MKKIKSLILILVLSSSAHAQKIHFTDTTNNWEVLDVFTGDPTPEFYYYSYYYINDSIIGTNAYKVFNSGALVREDTIAGKIFIIDPTSDSEKVMMNYNLNIGDTFKYNAFEHVVTGIDSTTIDSISYRVWHFQPVDGIAENPYDVIEGIGCAGGPTFMLNPAYFEGGPFVYCFSTKGTNPPLIPGVDYLDNSTSCYKFTHLYVGNIQTRSACKIFPNPANDQLTIQTNNSRPYTITLNNIMGQTIKTFQSNKLQETIDVSRLPAGLYYLSVIDEYGNRVNDKVVIVH